MHISKFLYGFILSSSLWSNAFAECDYSKYDFADERGDKAKVLSIKECYAYIGMNNKIQPPKQCWTSSKTTQKAQKLDWSKVFGTRLISILYKSKKYLIADNLIDGSPGQYFDVPKNEKEAMQGENRHTKKFIKVCYLDEKYCGQNTISFEETLLEEKQARKKFGALFNKTFRNLNCTKGKDY